MKLILLWQRFISLLYSLYNRKNQSIYSELIFFFLGYFFDGGFKFLKRATQGHRHDFVFVIRFLGTSVAEIRISSTDIFFKATALLLQPHHTRSACFFELIPLSI